MSFKSARRIAPVLPSHGIDDVTPQPFLKWAGGKAQLLQQLLPMVPRHGRYIEPFVGGGALFFAHRPAQALLADANAHLMACYTVVRDDVEALIALLTRHRAQHGEAFYYSMRSSFNTVELSPVERAAAFIYLNKTGFNGLYRENARGQHNVPFGRYANPGVFNGAALRAASSALRDVELHCQDFAALREQARPHDFIYFDPPYHPRSETARFTAYTRQAFDTARQEELALLYRELDARGCRLLLSNSDTPLVHALYKGFRIQRVSATRAINCVASARGAVYEVLVRNFRLR